MQLLKSHFPINDTEKVFDTTVGGLLRSVSASDPDQCALVEVDVSGNMARRWTYQALFSDAERLALALSTRFSPGERVCVWAPNIPEWVLLEYACALAGLVLVTANPAYQAKELRYVLEQSGASGLFLTVAYRGNPMAEIAREAVDGLAGIRELTDIHDLEALYEHGPNPAGLPEVKAADAAQVQYTSGTTGFPKGAVLSHRGLTNNARFYAQRLELERGDPWSTVMPLFHTAGCAMAVLGALQMASPLYLFAIFDPVSYLRTIATERVAFAAGVPTMIVAMLEVMKQEEFDLSAVKRVSSGGSMVAPQLVLAAKEAFGCIIQTVYGQTECSPLVTMHRQGTTVKDCCSTVGQALPQTEIAILSTDDSSIQPLGEVGEICVRGYGCMIEYHDNPDATAATVDPEGWLHTGDLGAMDARGYVSVTGRVKEMIIRGGENLFPAEIENTLLEHPEVAEVAVVGLPDEKWGEIVAAFVRPSDGCDLDAAILKAHCRAHLAPMKSPVVWSKVDAFPLTGSGKIRKFALRDMLLAGEISVIRNV